MPQAGATQFKTLNGTTEVIATPNQTSAGAADAGKVVGLNSSGKIDQTMMPTGVGADVVLIPATEALNAGAFVNIYSNSGAESARNADASAANGGKPANGFVLSAVASGATATVYLNGVNNAVTGQTPGPAFVGTAGAATANPATTSGYTLQNIGDAVSATSIHFQRGPVTVL